MLSLRWLHHITHIGAVCSHGTKNNHSSSTQPRTQPRTMSDSTIRPLPPTGYGWNKQNRRYGASLGGALCFINNPTLRLFSHTCLQISRTRLHTTSDDNQTRRHICTNNRQTPPPWWSRLPLQRHGFDETMPPEGWAALHMFVSMSPSKRFNRFPKLK